MPAVSANLDFLAAIERESHRFGLCLEGADPAAPVPTCPGWSAADLLWHLTEVQFFWAAIVGGRLNDPDAAEAAAPERPGVYADLLGLHGRATTALLDSLRGCDPATSVWTWAPDRSAGFVLRWQAHEALMHRLDAESAVGDVGPIEPALAEDGIDIVLRVAFGEVPVWGTFTGGPVGLVLATDTGRAWQVTIGRFDGTSPNTGTTYDEDALTVEAGNATAARSFAASGAAGALDAWLWNRPGEAISLTGDPDAGARFAALVRRGVQ